MDRQNTTTSPTNGASTPHDLFVLSDEQILEIEPEGEVSVAPPGARPDGVGRAASSPAQLHGAPTLADPDHSSSVILSEPQASEGSQLNSNRGSSHPEMPPGATTQAGAPVPSEPPPWLAAQMNDPWTGAEAKELWNGLQQTKQEAAAYRAAFATPEEARALKAMYPGGVNEARAAANRAQLLDQIDRAYFGASGGTPEQASAARSELAALMLREDPVAFREMVFAGLRALEEVNVTPPFRAASSPAAQVTPTQNARLKPGTAEEVHESPVTSHQSLSAYAAFEKAANEDLERSVGAAITRTIEQAPPVAQPLLAVHTHKDTQARVPALHERLAAAVRQDSRGRAQG